MADRTRRGRWRADPYPCKGVPFMTQMDAALAMERYRHSQNVRHVVSIYTCTDGNHWHYGVLS